MSTETNVYLIVHTDTYTGNIDSFLTGLLFHYDDDRVGAEDGKAFAEQFATDSDPELEDIGLADHPEADHNLPYNLYGDENKSLEFAFYSDYSELFEFLNNRWKGVKITPPPEAYTPAFTIKGFSVRTAVTNSVVVDL